MKYLAHFRWHHQHEHPQRAGRPAGQTDRRVQRPVHSHRELRQARRCWQGMAVHQRTRTQGPMCGLGWKSLGVLELTALPSIDRDVGSPGPGDGRPAGERRRSPVSVLLDAAVRTGGPLAVAAARGGLRGAERREHGDGSQRRGGLRPLETAHRWRQTLGLVDFAMFPHLDHAAMPDNSLANAEKWAAGMPVPAYVIDDQTAIQVVDGAVEVISEGHWKLFTP